MHRRDFLAHCVGGTAALAASPYASPLARLTTQPPAADRMAWWRDARFGMFLHFGLYSEPGGEWEGKPTGAHEWMRHNAKIPHESYIRLADTFNPVALDADAWVRAARDAGQRYVVLTTKHHEGFALFDSAVSRYTVRYTPYRRDICAQLARACRRYGLKLGWYYSIMDWYHPDYLPRRDWEQRDATGADFARYLAFMKAQLRELLTRYGDVAVLWFDGQWESTWTHTAALELEAYCRGLMPDVIINDRIDVGVPRDAPPGYRRGGDYTTPENTVPERGLPGTDWESCMTMNRNWGYAKDDQEWKSVPALVSLLVETASKGGNLLLNVGPRGDGRFPDESLAGLAGIGAWMRTNSRAIYGTRATPFARAPHHVGTDTPAPLRITCTDRALHLVHTEWAGGTLVLPGLHDLPRAGAVLGHPDVPVRWSTSPEGVTVTLPERGPVALLPVLELSFSRAVQVRDVRE